MNDLAPAPRSRLTLFLGILLHMFTHAYGAMLVPLYLLIQTDMHLRGIQYAALIVTVYGVTYYVFSYGAGILADRFNRRNLLGWGLVVNATAVIFMGLFRRYEMVLAMSVIGGLAGTLFHPAANALIPAHYPRSPGMVIGILGIGSGLGFFIGPQYAGWSAVHGFWHASTIGSWQRPCIELGILGIFCGIAFLIFAREAPGAHGPRTRPHALSWPMRWNVLAIAGDARLPGFRGCRLHFADKHLSAARPGARCGFGGIGRRRDDVDWRCRQPAGGVDQPRPKTTSIFGTLAGGRGIGRLHGALVFGEIHDGDVCACFRRAIWEAIR